MAKSHFTLPALPEQKGMGMVQLKQALHRKGYKVIDLYNRMSRSGAIDYQVVARYCRCINRDRHDKTIWKWIDSVLDEMEVFW